MDQPQKQLFAVDTNSYIMALTEQRDNAMNSAVGLRARCLMLEAELAKCKTQKEKDGGEANQKDPS